MWSGKNGANKLFVAHKCVRARKNPSGHTGEVDFELRQVTFHTHSPHEQAPGQNPLSTKWQHLFQ